MVLAMAHHPKPVDVRKARAYLHKRGVGPSVIRPQAFASAAGQLGTGYYDTLHLIIQLANASQGRAPPNPAPVATDIAMAAAAAKGS